MPSPRRRVDSRARALGGRSCAGCPARSSLLLSWGRAARASLTGLVSFPGRDRRSAGIRSLTARSAQEVSTGVNVQSPGASDKETPPLELRAGDSACSNRDGAGGAESRCRCHALVQPLRSKMGRCRSSRAVSHEQPPLARVAFRTSAPRFERARTKRRRSRDDSSATGRARSRAYSAPTATPASAAVRNGRSPTHP